MNKSTKFSPEVRERAVRMVHEHRGDYPSLWAVVESIAPKIGCVPQTLLDWVKREEVDAGQREGLSSSERERLKQLEWAAAGSIDTDLSFLSLLELYGTEIAERRMPTRRVVEALDVIEHI